VIMRKLFVLFVVAACGPTQAPPQVPMLPGDGDAHVVKPPPPKQPTAADPWAGRTDLITAPTFASPEAAAAPGAAPGSAPGSAPGAAPGSAPGAVPGAVPGAAPGSAIELPKITELKLANGLPVFVVRTDRLPVVSLQLAVRAGRMHEPRARLGVAELTADMLVKGTRRRDAAGLARAIDFVGGTIAADSTFEATLISCSVVARHAGTCFELVPEMITQPTFPEAELARMRDMVLGTLRQRLDDAGSLASAHAQNLLWGNEHVRGWINSEQSVSSLRRDDVVAWHRQRFVPGNAMLIITGDVDPRRLKADLERTFGGWRKGPVPPAPLYPEPGLSGSRIRIVDKPGQQDAQIRIAQFGIKHDDPRFFETLVWNYVLGGAGAQSRLTRVLRAGGKGYGVASSFDRNIDRGSFVASTVTRPADAVATTKVILAEIAKMAKEGPSKEEVAAAITNITGAYGLRFQTASDIGAALVGAELHGYGHEYLTNFPLVVSRIDVANAKRAASEILDPQAYVIVMVGDFKDLEPQLKKEGWRYERVSHTDPVTAPFRLPDVPVDAKSAAAASKLIEEALAAKGGKAKLAGLKSFKLLATGTTTIQGQTVPVEISRVFLLPDKMRIDATIKPPGAARDIVVSVGVLGKSGWQRAPDPKTNDYVVTEVAGDGLQTIEFERWREPELILLKAADPQAKLAPAPDEEVDGKPCSVVRLRSPIGGVDISLYIDKKTKLVTRMSYTDGGNTESDDFADYRDVGGVKFAHKRTSTGGGRSTTLQLKSVELDGKLDPKLFDKPAAK
jgi:zinc protease